MQSDNIVTIVSANNLFIPNNEILYHVEVFNVSFSPQFHTLSYSYMVLTRDSAFFEFLTVFQCDANMTQRSKLFTFLQRSYMNYGSNTPSRVVTSFQGKRQFLFSVAYFNRQSREITLAVYNRSRNDSMSNSSYIPIVTMTGGYVIQNGDERNFDFSFIADADEHPKLLTTTPEGHL